MVLIQLLDYLQSGKTYSIQDLAELLHKDVETVRVELEYLEHQGYISKIDNQTNCGCDCNRCHGCEQSTVLLDAWSAFEHF